MNKATPLYRLKAYIGKAVIACFEYTIELFDGKIVFADPHRVSGVREIEAAIEVITAEYQHVASRQKLQSMQTFFLEQQAITRDDGWTSFPLFLFSQRFEDNIRECPETVRLLQGIEGMTAAMFSVLRAGAVITPHRGPYKGVLRYHLGVIVPEPPGSCYIEVDGQRGTWAEGESLLFDDTHIHAAFNTSTHDRVVLFVDIVRPLPFPLNVINHILFRGIARSEYVKDVLKLYTRQAKSLD